MADTFTIVRGIPHIYQFEPGRSEYRCEAAVLTALSMFAYPNHFSDPSALMHEIYVKYVSGGDVPANQQGMTKEEFLAWCASPDTLGGKSIGIHDLQAIVDSGDMDALRLEMAAMNACGIPVALGIADESHLYQAVQNADESWSRGPKLHNWSDTGLAHVIIRIGMDMVHPITLISDPAANCPPFKYPTPILWEDLVACRMTTAIGVMPPGIPTPAPGFRFYENGVQHVWPVPPVAPPDYEAIEADMIAFKTELEAERAASDVRIAKILAELAAH